MTRNVSRTSFYTELSYAKGLRFEYGNTENLAVSTIARELLAEGWEEVTDPSVWAGWRKDYRGARLFKARGRHADRICRVHPLKVNGSEVAGNQKW